MAKYQVDHRDLDFVLFEQLEVQNSSKDFEASDLKEIITQFDRFVESEVYPTRIPGDEEGVTLTEDKGVVVPKSFHQATKQYYENGWYALGYPEEIGGMPAPHCVTVACAGLYVGANVSLSMYSGLSQGAMNVILQVGSDEQKKKYIPQMMEGRWGGTMCLTEPGAGSDVGAAKATATPNDDGTHSIKGVKIFISSGENDLYENIIHLVLAKTPGSPEGSKGLSLFIVPRFSINEDNSNAEFNNVKCTKIEEKMGIHGSATCELTFGAEGDCRGVLIGKENDGMANMFIMMNEARLLCGLQGEAQASLAYQLSLQYAKERSQFGREIIKHPDVKRTLLKMRAMARGMKALSLYTANLFDKAHQGDESAENEIAFLTPICKSYCSDEGFQVCVDAIQVHGGYGFCSEYGIEQFARDTKIATIYEGTNGIQAIDFVMRKILKDEGKVFQEIGKKIMTTLSLKECSDWSSEIALLSESVKKAGEIVSLYAGLAGKKEVNTILASSTDFQNFCGNLIVGHILLEAALKAKAALGKGEAEDDKFYESKIVDFKIFCQHYLTRNSGIAESILSLGQNIDSLEL